MQIQFDYHSHFTDLTLKYREKYKTYAVFIVCYLREQQRAFESEYEKAKTIADVTNLDTKVLQMFDRDFKVFDLSLKLTSTFIRGDKLFPFSICNDHMEKESSSNPLDVQYNTVSSFGTNNCRSNY